MEFELNDEIKKLGISKLQRSNENVCVYNRNGLAQPTYFKGELQKTLSELKEKMVFCGHFGYEKKVQKIIILISNIIVDWEESNKNNKDEQEKKQEQHKIKIYRTARQIRDNETIFVDQYRAPHVFVQIKDHTEKRIFCF